MVHQYFTHFTTDVVSRILNHSTFAEPETREHSFHGNFCYLKSPDFLLSKGPVRNGYYTCGAPQKKGCRRLSATLVQLNRCMSAHMQYGGERLVDQTWMNGRLQSVLKRCV
ncbi:hypothetical protein DPMN_096715 [Dreissena polymorpha]|uniref:Uncharacterized protein n=1 Tax=Dreissena polymorpha TaxID=45954 RepID=A0A9D4R505_DREPO|nr:hypothetical protein DPMN_096715 [Dreissena polymorpha]